MPSVNPAKFFSEVKAELLKVSWPTKKEVSRLTVVVIVVSLIVGSFIGLLDFVFTKAIEFLLK